MKRFLKENIKKLFVGMMAIFFGFGLLGMTQIPESKAEAAPITNVTAEVYTSTVASVKYSVVNTQISMNFDSLTDSSLSQIESMIPDEAKYLASQELGSASRREYIQWFYHHGYIPAELLGVAVAN